MSMSPTVILLIQILSAYFIGAIFSTVFFSYVGLIGSDKNNMDDTKLDALMVAIWPIPLFFVLFTYLTIWGKHLRGNRGRDD